VFESERATEATGIDDFNMDLFLTLGRYDNIAHMLECLDCFEYEFLLEKYKTMQFGSSMQNYMLAQLAWININQFSKSHIKLERLIMGEIGELQATNGDRVAIALMRDNYVGYYEKQGFSREEAIKLAEKSTKEYADNLRQRRLEEEVQKQNSQDLGNA